jgi:hypothetical protein
MGSWEELDGCFGYDVLICLISDWHGWQWFWVETGGMERGRVSPNLQVVLRC